MFTTGAFGTPILDCGFGSDRAQQQKQRDQPLLPVGGFGPDQAQQQQQQRQQQSTTKHTNGSSPISVRAIAAMPCELKSFEELRLEDHIAGNQCTRRQPVLESLPLGFGGFKVTLGKLPIDACKFNRILSSAPDS